MYTSPKAMAKFSALRLAGHGEACMLAKEVLAPVDLAGLGEGRILESSVVTRNHLAGALAVT